MGRISNLFNGFFIGTLLLLLCGSAANSQVIFSEDFESGTLTNFSNANIIGPINWVNTNNRGADGGHSPSRAAYFGDTTIFSYNLNTHVRGSLISTSINLTSYSVVWLSFTYYLQTETYHLADIASIQISTDGINYDTLGNNDLSFNNISDDIGRWDTLQLSISAYAGNATVYIRFDFNSIDSLWNMFEGFYVDDVKVWAPVSADASLDSVYGSEYSMIPLLQAMPITFSGKVSNVGSLTLTNVDLAVDVISNTSSVFNNNVVLSSLPINSDSILVIPTQYTPTAKGSYNANFSVSVTENDSISSNDTLRLNGDFIVTDTIYARDNGDSAGAGVGFGAGTGSLGQVFKISVPDTLTSISIFLDAVNAGDAYSFSIYQWISDTTGAKIFTSTPDTFTGTEDDKWTTYRIDPPQSLVVGEYLVLLDQLDTTGSIFLGYDTDVDGIIIGTPKWTSYTGFGNPMLRLNLGVIKVPDTMVAINSIPVDPVIGIYPNPTYGQFEIELAYYDDVSICIYDLLGVMITERKLENVNSDRLTFDLSNRQEGVYFVAIMTPKKKFVKKIILLH